MGELVVVTAAHNEEIHLPYSIRALIRACDTANSSWEQVIVLDRCTDRSETIARGFSKKHPNITIHAKTKVKWKHTYAENLMIGFEYAVKTKADCFAVVDADIILEKEYVAKVLPAVSSPRTASASGTLITAPLHQTVHSSIYRAWERSYRIGLHVAAWGASRVYRMEPLLSVGGFADFASPDTELDIRLSRQGFRHRIIPEAKAYHIRDISVGNSLRAQVKLGISRHELGVPFHTTVLHGIFRFRPGLIAGHLIGAVGEDREPSPRPL